jgi:hypothetical protein
MDHGSRSRAHPPSQRPVRANGPKGCIWIEKKPVAFASPLHARSEQSCSWCVTAGGLACFSVQAAGSKCYPFMMTLEDIQQAVAKLSPEDRRKLRLWLAEFEAGQAEHREDETTASKLGRLAGRAVADFRKRMREP